MNNEELKCTLKKMLSKDAEKQTRDIDRKRIILRIMSSLNSEEGKDGRIIITCMGVKCILSYVVADTDDMLITKPMTPDMLIMAGLGTEGLFEMALQNTLRYNPPQIAKMNDLMEKFREENEEQLEDEEYVPFSDDVYAVTGQYPGASVALLDRNTLKELSERIGDDICVIPESKDILIAVGMNSEYGMSLVHSINYVQSCMGEEQTRINENVYFYEKQSGNIGFGCLDQIS